MPSLNELFVKLINTLSGYRMKVTMDKVLLGLCWNNMWLSVSGLELKSSRNLKGWKVNTEVPETVVLELPFICFQKKKNKLNFEEANKTFIVVYCVSPVSIIVPTKRKIIWFEEIYSFWWRKWKK